VIPYVTRVLRGVVTVRWAKSRCATSQVQNWVTWTLTLKDSPSLKMHMRLGVKQLQSVWVAKAASFRGDSKSNRSRLPPSVQNFRRSECFYPTHLIIFNFVQSKPSCSIPSCARSYRIQNYFYRWYQPYVLTQKRGRRGRRGGERERQRAKTGSISKRTQDLTYSRAISTQTHAVSTLFISF